MSNVVMLIAPPPRARWSLPGRTAGRSGGGRGGGPLLRAGGRDDHTEDATPGRPRGPGGRMPGATAASAPATMRHTGTSMSQEHPGADRLSPDRVEMVEIASVQYVRLVEAMRSMEERAERLGPIDLLEGDA